MTKIEMMKSSLAIVLFAFCAAHADETVQQKTQDQVDSAKTQANKSGRKLKQTARNATGQKNVAKDAGDKVSNAADDVSDTAKKEKRKVD